MARIRSIMKPHKEGKNVTLSEARSVFRQLNSNVPQTRPFVDDQLFKQVQTMNERREKKVIKTRSRLSRVIPEMVGHTIAVRNGREFVAIDISENMVGRQLGELAGKSRPQRFRSTAAKSTSKAR
jgi:small subunit ribosomal protein S19